MPEAPVIHGASLEIISADTARRVVRITESPFLIGRGGDGNHLQLDERRVSRQSAAIVSGAGRYFLEDRGQRNGLFVSGKQIDRCELKDGNVITFGPEGSLEVIFRSAAAANTSIQNLFTRIQGISGSASGPGGSAAGGLHKLNLLLEATMLLHSQLPLELRAQHDARPRDFDHRRGPGHPART